MLFLLGRKFNPVVVLVAAAALLVVGLVLHLEFLVATSALSLVLAGVKTARRLRTNHADNS
jgi:hypothetical protein